MKGNVYSLIRIIREEAEIGMPEVEKQVDSILGQLGDDAGDALADVVKDDPELMADVIDDNPATLQSYIQNDPHAIDMLGDILDSPEVMAQLSSSPDAISSMSSYYEENPDDIPDALVRQVTAAVSDDKATPKGDLKEYYENMLHCHHIDGQPWSGTLQDLADVQGKTFGGGTLVNPKRFDKEVRTAVKFATGTVKSPFKMTERMLREVIRHALMELRVR